jgi:UDPglucose 6-dehydrogenase
MMRVSIVGTGYVGLVSGACLAERGHSVICVDNDRAKIDMIRGKNPPFFEAGLEDLLERTYGTRLEAVTDLEQAVLDTDITLIAVGTPFDGRNIDLSYVRAVAREIGMALEKKKGYHVVAVKSTVVPGTTDRVVLPILERHSGKRAGEAFGIGMNPEFLTEGRAIHDFMNPDRIVVGGIDGRSQDCIEALYESFDRAVIVRTNNTTAEMIKYASNALLATMISFSNELANLCTSLGGTDIKDVMAGVHASDYLSVTDPAGGRIAAPITKFLEAGCGFGGSCLPKDVKALISHGEAAGVPMPILASVIGTNAERPGKMLELLGRHFDSLAGLRVAVLGLAFKPGTDDVRESPAFPIMRMLLDAGAQVRAYDPAAVETAKRVLDDPRIAYCSGLGEAVAGADAVMLVTRWKEFLELPELLRATDPPPILIDGRRLIDKSSVSRYEGIGL